MRPGPANGDALAGFDSIGSAVRQGPTFEDNKERRTDPLNPHQSAQLLRLLQSHLNDPEATFSSRPKRLSGGVFSEVYGFSLSSEWAPPANGLAPLCRWHRSHSAQNRTGRPRRPRRCAFPGATRDPCGQRSGSARQHVYGDGTPSRVADFCVASARTSSFPTSPNSACDGQRFSWKSQNDFTTSILRRCVPEQRGVGSKRHNSRCVGTSSSSPPTSKRSVAIAHRMLWPG